mmetsp:Transcript_20483/g.34051  ORF Transcript_20483/g.34051 Transcript_20483/m.34051 type:complete len:244 (-) Transcript_20483:655-1386(-)
MPPCAAPPPPTHFFPFWPDTHWSWNHLVLAVVLETAAILPLRTWQVAMNRPQRTVHAGVCTQQQQKADAKGCPMFAVAQWITCNRDVFPFSHRVIGAKVLTALSWKLRIARENLARCKLFPKFRLVMGRPCEWSSSGVLTFHWRQFCRGIVFRSSGPVWFVVSILPFLGCWQQKTPACKAALAGISLRFVHVACTAWTAWMQCMNCMHSCTCWRGMFIGVFARADGFSSVGFAGASHANSTSI